MSRFGLLGEKLGHSYSPYIHTHFGLPSYDLFEVKKEDVESFVRSSFWQGLNVTVPYKKEVFKFCDSLSETAKATGSVNTLVRRPNGEIFGDNTDVYGFYKTVELSGVDIAGKKAVILGSGGASSAVKAALERFFPSEIITVSRNGDNNYDNISKHADAAIVVNATPVGMYPNVGVSPVDVDVFESLEAVYDVIYNPADTKLMLDAKKKGIKTFGGLSMLCFQAQGSFKYFGNKEVLDRDVLSLEKKLKGEMKNIVLIGMPSSGKSTVAKLLGEKLNREVIDTDEQIVLKSGTDIPSIFSAYGEKHFRKIESEVLSEVGKLSGKIISTGGGIVTVSENFASIKQNGTVFWLKRDLNLLETDGRPISQSRNLEELFSERSPLYEAFCDFTVDNNGTPEHTADTIIDLI